MPESMQFATGALLLATLLAFAVSGAWLLRRLQVLEATLRRERDARDELARDVAALLECSRELGGRVREQAARQKSVTDRLNRVAQQVDGNGTLDQVERLLADGVGVEQISRVCELSQGEAALLQRWKLHQGVG